MRVKISNFRCIESSEYEFLDGALLLLDAPSGTGKSTIMEAILWCLYGGMRDVYPFKLLNDSKKSCRVELEIDGVSVVRQKPPERLILNENGSTMENADAQGRIEFLFGEKDVWIATSYMKQGTEHPLIARSAAEKFNLLHNLTFGATREYTETPEYYLDKTNDVIRGYSDELKKIEGANEYIMKRFTELDESLEAAKAAWGDRSLEDIERLITEEDETQSEINLLEMKRHNHLLLHGKRESLVERLEAEKSQLNGLRVEYEQLEPLDESRLKTLISKRELLSKRQDISQKIYRLKMLDYVAELPETDIERLSRDCHIMKTGRQIVGLRGLNVSKMVEECRVILEENRIYSERTDAISAERLRYEEHVSELKRHYAEQKTLSAEIDLHNSLIREYERTKANYDRYLNSKARREKLLEEAEKMKPSEYIISDILAEKIRETKRELEAYVCPKCKTGLKVRRGKLSSVHSDEERRRLEADLLIFIDEERKSREYEAKLAEASAVLVVPEPSPGVFQPSNSELGDSRVTPLTVPRLKIPSFEEFLPKELRQASQKKVSSEIIASAEAFVNAAIDFPTEYTIPEIMKALGDLPEYQRLHEELDSLEPLPAGTSLNSLVKEHQKLSELSERHTRLKTEIRLHEKSLNETQKTLENIPETTFNEENFNALRKRLKSTHELIKAGLEITRLEEERANTLDSQKELKRVTELLESAIRLRNVVEDISIVSMQSSIVSLESSTNNILKNLFDEPLRISINTTKETEKSKSKNTRPKFLVNLGVVYRGYEYSSLSCLSGGETNRLNLALTLAMSNVSGSKMLLLDEVLNTLDSEMKDRAIQVIRAQAEGKTIVNVCHDSVAGLYSDVIRV